MSNNNIETDVWKKIAEIQQGVIDNIMTEGGAIFTGKNRESALDFASSVSNEANLVRAHLISLEKLTELNLLKLLLKSAL